MNLRPKNLLRNVAKTAIKASPIPVPDVVQEKMGLGDTILTDSIVRIEEKIDRILAYIKELDDVEI
tara:strand:- start:1485 stop:1682 length:198 start_codon:yes stop_codon:yes gene_type:complete